MAALPPLPRKLAEFIPYLLGHPTTPVPDLLEPYKQYESKLRELFAREPENQVLQDGCVNAVPVFDGHASELTVRARDLAAETEEEKAKFIMPLKEDERKAHGSPAVVPSFKQFQKNFNLFSESSLCDIDWNNVIAAGSSVVTALLPVPKAHNSSKRAVRHYYHDVLAPASDVDLFLYGLTEEEAIEKIKQIEQRIRDSILQETTCIRTKNAITIASQYPVRHIQIVLRIYKSISEILTGFDVDCSCVAYDGKQVYASPRALAAFLLQRNTLDLTRRSPSYESRLSKYSHRGFEVHWPLLERSRVDPTIFERSFTRTVGLARLLVLEKLPKKTDRESYRDARRAERGRPPVNQSYGQTLSGNRKEEFDEDLDEVDYFAELSDYSTFTIPYGPKYHAKKIEKLLYKKDLLLNAEWNKSKDRKVHLHRHPAFFGYAEDCLRDCCGYCPEPVTEEEIRIAEEESKIYVPRDVAFIKDNPGRQAIGSFSPITTDDWTEMAYVADNAKLCQAIVDGDLDEVRSLCADPNRRDYTGRTPLHLACQSSTPEIVQFLVDKGARIAWRVADGRTALHFAASRGDTTMIRTILRKSEENEELEAKKEDTRKQKKRAASEDENNPQDEESSASDGDRMSDGLGSDQESDSFTEGSFIKVKAGVEQNTDDALPIDEEDTPDIIDPNCLTWDAPAVTPLHSAIINGHTDAVTELVESFGADVLLPIKLFNSYNKSPRGAIMTLVLTVWLPAERARDMTRTLLHLGASSAQADMNLVTVLHYLVAGRSRALDLLFSHDGAAAKKALNVISVDGSAYSTNTETPIGATIIMRESPLTLQLLEAGANASVSFGDFMAAYQTKFRSRDRSDDPDTNKKKFEECVQQPIILAVAWELPAVALELLARGADPNTVIPNSERALRTRSYGYFSSRGYEKSVLDMVQAKIKVLREYSGEGDDPAPPTPPTTDDRESLEKLRESEQMTYSDFVIRAHLESREKDYNRKLQEYEENLKQRRTRKGLSEKTAAIHSMLFAFEKLEAELVKNGAKTLKELRPDLKCPDPTSNPTDNKQHERDKPTFKISFKVGDLTEPKREAYIKLYEAIWSNTAQAFDVIKSLTLATWGPDENSPLKIAIRDNNGYSPFDIAVLRGNLELAARILQIAQLQYAPPRNEGDVRYKMGGDSDEDSSEYSDSDSDGMDLVTETIQEEFTLDVIAEGLSAMRSSHVKPKDLLESKCDVWLFPRGGKIPDGHLGSDNPLKEKDYRFIKGRFGLIHYAIYTDNLELLDFLLTQRIQYIGRCIFPDEEFRYAIYLGRVRLLGVLLQRTCAGIPLESIVEKTGIEAAEKPKYYQGLSVHGRKRADWAKPRWDRDYSGRVGMHPLLLEAARVGNLDSVKWCLGDSPLRKYSEFALQNPEHESVQALAKADGGFDRAASRWLNTDRNLAIHCTLLADQRNASTDVLDYLIQALPSSIHAKSARGWTPLHISFALGLSDAASHLISAGADRTCRDRKGNNILHALLYSVREEACNDPAVVQRMLSLLDKPLITALSVERSLELPGAATPIACWLHALPSDRQSTTCKTLDEYERIKQSEKQAKERAELMRILLNFSSGEELNMVNGEGDTPLHVAVKREMPELVQVILDHNSALLYRENATGRTPLEMAQDDYLSGRLNSPPELPSQSTSGWYYDDDRWKSVVTRDPELFVLDEPDLRSSSKKCYDICVRFAGTHPGKRRLVSLVEANEVARRLALKKGSRYDGDEAEKPAHVKDEFELMMSEAVE